VTRQDNEVAAGVIVEDRAWLEKLHGELRGLLAPVFAQARSRFTAFAYIGALLAERGDRKSCWQLAEAAGHATPRRMQALLAGHAWDWTAALAGLQRFIVTHLGDPEAIVVLDETAELKKGGRTVGVGRQHAGITGQVENCQTVVFAAYVTARAHALFRFPALPAEAVVPGQGAAGAGARPGRDRVHHQARAGDRDAQRRGGRGRPVRLGGRRRGIRPQHQAARGLREGREGICRRDAGELPVALPSGRRTTVSAVARMIPAAAWETRSCGRGCKGHRDYAWAWAATASPRHWVLIRRSLADPSDLAFYYCHAPQGRPVSLPVLIKVAGKRWPVEECLQQGKGQAGLDQHQVRTWHSFHRHTVLSMCAQALFAVAAARPAPSRDDLPAVGDGQPAAWRDTGKLPATADDRPPGDDPGLVKVSVPEARRLVRLATAPISRTARDLGYAWSRWRRRHQARARWHHYHTRLKAARVT
jgi:hypothetical protein